MYNINSLNSPIKLDAQDDELHFTLLQGWINMPQWKQAERVKASFNQARSSHRYHMEIHSPVMIALFRNASHSAKLPKALAKSVVVLYYDTLWRWDANIWENMRFGICVALDSSIRNAEFITELFANVSVEVGFMLTLCT